MPVTARRVPLRLAQTLAVALPVPVADNVNLKFKLLRLLVVVVVVVVVPCTHWQAGIQQLGVTLAASP